MEAAETEFLRSVGLSVCWREGSRHVGFPRVSAACDYSKPARFEDVLDIAVSLERIGEKSVTYRFDFTRGAEAIAVGQITSVYCEETAHGLESRAIPPSVRAKLV